MTRGWALAQLHCADRTWIANLGIANLGIANMDWQSSAIGEGKSATTGRAKWPAMTGWSRHQRLKALTTSHPRVAIHANVASKAITSMAMQSHPDRRSGAGVLVELAGSTTSGRSM
jgi:hypothetical protein